MTIFENLKIKNIDEVAEWMSENCSSDDSPWWEWWDKHYCKKCESISCFVPAFGREADCTWCELNDNKCKFFPDMGEMPNEKEIVRMWLESECENYED